MVIRAPLPGQGAMPWRTASPRITKRSVDAVRAEGTDAVFWDGELTGFGLRVRRSGRKSYVVQTRVAGKLRWFTIGPHGPLNPDQARARALGGTGLCQERHRSPRCGRSARGRSVHGRSRAQVPGGIRPSPLQAEHTRGIPPLGGAVRRPRDRELRVSEVRRKDIAALHHGLRDKPYQGQPDARGAVEDLLPGRGLGLAVPTAPTPAVT